jgi:hypothetical protein
MKMLSNAFSRVIPRNDSKRLGGGGNAEEPGL